jgi:hypothetical protein
LQYLNAADRIEVRWNRVIPGFEDQGAGNSVDLPFPAGDTNGLLSLSAFALPSGHVSPR